MTSEPGWLLLIHQIPQNPGYLRVKVWRRLQRVGAVAIKSSVYVLPASEQTREDFEWTLREIVQGGGDASICEARFVEGLSVEQVEALFDAARDADYAQIAEEARELGAATETPSRVELARLRRRLEEVSAIDFFGAPGRALAEAALLSAEARVRSASQSEAPAGEEIDFRARTWVTRKGIHVDRMASAPGSSEGSSTRRHGSSSWLARVIYPSRRSCGSTCSRQSSRTRAMTAHSRC